MLAVCILLRCILIDVFLEGTQILNDTSHELLKKQYGYVVRIQIIQLNDNLDVPLTSNRNDDGVRDFTNDMDNEIVYIDKLV